MTITRLQQQEVSDSELRDFCENADVDPDDIMDDPEDVIDKNGEFVIRTGMYYHKADKKWYYIPESQREKAMKEILEQ